MIQKQQHGAWTRLSRTIVAKAISVALLLTSKTSESCTKLKSAIIPAQVPHMKRLLAGSRA